MRKNGPNHGWSRTGTYKSWLNARERCYRKSNNRYPQYGGRGIRMCEQWSDFLVFLADMGERPAGHTLDRRDTDGDYTPDNCRWAPIHVQRANQRRTILDEKKVREIRALYPAVSKQELAKRYGVSREMVREVVLRKAYKWVTP